MDPGGKLPDTGVVVIICGAQLPPWFLPHKHLQQRVALGWQVGASMEGGGPTGPGCSLSHCLCCFSVPAVGALTARKVATLVSLRLLFLCWGLCLGGSCLWVWSVQTPCFKGSGRELASKASPQLIKNFFLFLNHHVFISHWNKVSF